MDDEQRLASIEFNLVQLRNRVRRLEELEDTMNTPLLRRLLFALDGWPWFRVVERPQWRPWRRWWTS
jgi:hypothetical protein